MNEKREPQITKITPLFQSSTPWEPLSEETMLRFLDESDDNDAKRSFLNRCALSEKALEEWDALNQVVEAGKDLPLHKPDHAIRSRILDAAYAATQKSLNTNVKSLQSSGLPGWRWAWAALFLAALWTGYQEITPATGSLESTTIIGDTLDADLLTLENDLNLLQTDLGFDGNSSFDASVQS